MKEKELEQQRDESFNKYSPIAPQGKAKMDEQPVPCEEISSTVYAGKDDEDVNEYGSMSFENKVKVDAQPAAESVQLKPESIGSTSIGKTNFPESVRPIVPG